MKNKNYALNLFFLMVITYLLPAQSPISILDVSNIIKVNTSNDYTYSGSHANARNPYNQNNVNYRVRFNRGNQQDIQLDGFTHANHSYFVHVQQDYFIKLKRVDSTLNIGQRELLFYQYNSYDATNRRLDVAPSFIGDMEATLANNIINRGTDNVFGNTPSQNINNIERIDVVFPKGIKTNYIADVGFLILERGGNDPFAIAAITSLNADSTPASYRKLLHVPVSAWGKSNINPRWVIMRQESNDNIYRIVEDIGNQAISGVFFNFNDLDINPNETVYGYSLFGADVDTLNHVLTNPATFPRNTSNATGAAGGLDIISIPGFFHNSMIVLENNFFKKFTVEHYMNNILLNWTIANPDWDGIYALQKSPDKQIIQEIGTIAANGQTQYEFQTLCDPKIKSYYRVKRIDDKGDVELSDWQAVQDDFSSNFSIHCLGNPVSTNIDLEIIGVRGETLTICLIDNYGRILELLTNQTHDDERKISFSALNFTAGFYFIKVQRENGESKTISIVKN